MSTSAIVQKLWNYCNVLRDDGMSYGDYVEAAPAHSCARGIRTSCSSRLTYLLFLKMADEQNRSPFKQSSPIPKGYNREALLKLDGDDLEMHYRHTLTMGPNA